MNEGAFSAPSNAAALIFAVGIKTVNTCSTFSDLGNILFINQKEGQIVFLDLSRTQTGYLSWHNAPIPLLLQDI